MTDKINWHGNSFDPVSKINDSMASSLDLSLGEDLLSDKFQDIYNRLGKDPAIEKYLDTVKTQLGDGSLQISDWKDMYPLLLQAVQSSEQIDFAPIEEATVDLDTQLDTLATNLDEKEDEEKIDLVESGLGKIWNLMDKGERLLKKINVKLSEREEGISLQSMMKLSADMTVAGATLNLAVSATKQVIDGIKGVMNTPL